MTVSEREFGDGDYDDDSSSSSSSEEELPLEGALVVFLIFAFFFWITRKTLRRWNRYRITKRLRKEGKQFLGAIIAKQRIEQGATTLTNVEYELTVEYEFPVVPPNPSINLAGENQDVEEVSPVTSRHRFKSRQRGLYWNRVNHVSLWMHPTSGVVYTNQFYHEFRRIKPLSLWSICWLYGLFVLSDLYNGDKKGWTWTSWVVGIFLAAVVIFRKQFAISCGSLQVAGMPSLFLEKLSRTIGGRSLVSAVFTSANGNLELESLQQPLAARIDSAMSGNLDNESENSFSRSCSPPAPSIHLQQQSLYAQHQKKQIPQRRLFYPAVVIPFRRWHIGPVVIWNGGFMTPQETRLKLLVSTIVAVLFFGSINANSFAEGAMFWFGFIAILALLVYGTHFLGAAWRALWKVRMKDDSKKFVKSIKSFLDHRGRMQTVVSNQEYGSSIGALEAMDIMIHSGGILDLTDQENVTYKAEYQQQQGINGQPVQNLEELYFEAEKVQSHFETFLQEMVKEVGGIGSDSIVFAPLKGNERAMEKAKDDYSNRSPGPGCSWLYDIVRASVVCVTPDQIIEVVRYVEANSHIVQAKNRFANPTCSGYRDLIFHLRISATATHHICELQIHLESIRSLEIEVGSHSVYEYLRSYFQGSMGSVAGRIRDLEAIAASSNVDRLFIANLLMSYEIARIERLATLFESELEESNIAQALWERIVAVLENSPYENCVVIAEANFKLGNLSFRKGQYRKALKFLENALERWKSSSMGDDHVMAAEALDMISQAYRKSGNIALAESSYQRSRAIQQETARIGDDFPSPLADESDVERGDSFSTSVLSETHLHLPLLGTSTAAIAPYPSPSHLQESSCSDWCSDVCYRHCPRLFCFICLWSIFGPYITGRIIGGLILIFPI